MDDNLHDCLSLCGLNDAQITAIETEGFLTLSDFGNLRYTDVSEGTKKLSNLDDADGGVYFGQAIVIKLRALVYWLNDCDRRGLEPDVNSFDNNELKRMIVVQRMEADNPTTEKGDSTVKAPDKFHPESMRGWSVFKRQLENYLQNLLGVRKVPLAYVIRLDPPPEDLPDDKMTELIYQVPLEGDAYEIDNRKVYRIILDAVADTEAYAWIKEIRNQDGRGQC